MKTERENKRPRISMSASIGNRDGNNNEKRNDSFDRKDGNFERRREGFDRNSGGGNDRFNRFDRPAGGNREGGFNRESNNNRDFNRNDRDGNRSFDRKPGFGRPTQPGENRPNNFERRTPGGYNREGGQSREGGYNREGGQSREGGYNREGGFNRDNNFNREGGFRKEGGYNREGNFNREGSYNREGGGFNREGGFNRNSDQPRRSNDGGGYNRNGGSSYNQNRNDRPNNYGNRSEGFDKPRRPFNNEGGGERPERPFNNNRGFDKPFRPSGDGAATRSNDRPYSNNNFRDRNSGSGYGQQRPSGGGFNRGGRPGNNGGGGFRSNDRFSSPPRPRPNKPIEYQDTITDPNAPIRLNKYLANAGVCSRREADEFIQAGVVKVNGEVVTELGTKVHLNDTVNFHDEPVKIERKIYVLLNKPKDCVTTADDPQARLTVMDLVKNACTERIYPVGRLDKNTTGVLLMTNDGDLASKLMHPKFLKKKIYHVWLDKDIPKEDLEKIAEGVDLEDGEIHADAISYANEFDRNQVGVEIHSGRNRIVRRIFEHLGYRVVKLDRVYFAGLTKKQLPRGTWRYLSQTEVNMLRMGAFE